MLNVSDVSFSYGSGEVLRDVTFELDGGVGCLLGPNGAGKSTLLKCIAGVLAPQKGSIELDGVELTSLDYRERARLVSYAPQEFNVAFPYRVIDVVLMGRNPHVNPLCGPGDEDVRIALDALRNLGLEKLAERPFSELSGGQKRLVIVARAIAQGGRLLLFDEPTSFLDFRNQYLVLSLIQKISKKLDKLTLLSLHDPNQALEFCDVIFMMRQGRIVGWGPTEVVTPGDISRLYDMDVVELRTDGRRLILPGKGFIEAKRWIGGG
ncbi:ABC transporter ATP-binding protein [Thermococcus henrietii]|uniref:ABC transporter ATP-binding protein n=1 Tax=Thermococcus henrietii TaxID=2016361 RepID=UPI000C078E5E|nr:ABC transporter ATP-binding protein [Thermococcus henrietii]